MRGMTCVKCHAKTDIEFDSSGITVEQTISICTHWLCQRCLDEDEKAIAECPTMPAKEFIRTNLRGLCRELMEQSAGAAAISPDSLTCELRGCLRSAAPLPGGEASKLATRLVHEAAIEFAAKRLGAGP